LFSSRSGALTAPLLPWDNRWGNERPPGRLIATVVFAGVIAILAIPYSINAASNGNAARTVLGVAIALVGVTFALALVPNLRVRRRTLPRDISPSYSGGDTVGLRIPFRSSWALAVVLWLAAAVVFLVIRAYLFFSHLSADHDSGRSAIDAGGIVVVVVAVAIAALMIRYLLTGKNRRGRVDLNEEGISLALGSSVRSISWSDVGDISPAVANNSLVIRVRPRSGNKIRVEVGRSLLDRMQRGYYEQNMDLHASVLDVDPALLLHMVQFYQQHPEARNELTTDAVIDRIQKGELI